MRTKSKGFHAKILLFGEYSLMAGSRALTIPFKHYNAALYFPEPLMDWRLRRMADHSNKQLLAFLQFLHELESEPLIRGVVDLDAFAEDLRRGIYLASDIPSGYGLGSSGVLVAAVFSRYSRKPVLPADKISPQHLAELKMIFSSMEAFFHGASSGLDPLSAFVDRPLLIGHNQEVSVSTPLPPNNGKGDGGFFLVNTQISRKTSSLVAIFQQKLKSKAFNEMLRQEYIALNDACIDATLCGDTGLSRDISRLSHLQLDLFHEMIPESFRSLWIEGLTSGQYALKLCGAGGGGFLLGYTDNYGDASSAIQTHTSRLIKLPVD